jgi:sec-independent protein translocase protein TatA
MGAVGMPFGGIELIVLLVIILLFFGAKRVPELARSLGVGARELKKAASEDNEERESKAVPQGADGSKTGVASEASPSERDGARTEGRETRDN